MIIKLGDEVAMFDITKEPTHDKVNSSPLTLVKNELFTIKKEPGTSFNQNTDIEYGTSSSYCPITKVKAEVLDDATLSEDEGSVGPGCSSYTAAVTKQELDIGPTQLQPPDMHYMLQPCKPDPDGCEPLHRIIEDGSQDQELQVLEEEEFTQQPDNELLLQHSPGSLPQGICGSVSPQDTERVNASSLPAHIDVLPAQRSVTSPAGRTRKRTACTCPNCGEGERKKQHACHHAGCGRLYARVSHLRTHLRCHSGERPFPCAWPACGKRFARSDELRRHRRTHTGERLYECPECEKRFMRSDHLAKHAQTHCRMRRRRRGRRLVKTALTREDISEDSDSIGD